MTLNKGRFTADSGDDVTVFLIGMRINKPLRVDKWLPVVRAMPRMLVHLSKDKSAGLLGFGSWFGRTTMLVSYWRSPEHLHRFASSSDAPHLPAWRNFVKRVGNDGSVGIWHETYVVAPSSREVVYVNMPPFGLGQAIGVEPVGAGSQTAKQRLGRAAR